MPCIGKLELMTSKAGLLSVFLFIFASIWLTQWYFLKKEEPILANTEHFLKQKVSKQNNIVMFTAIFGKSPAYLPLFLRSIKDADISLVIIGTPIAYELPPNVRHANISWAGFVSLVSTRLFNGQALNSLNYATMYKVCEFKPLFAHLFPEYVTGFEWWGYMDNDLIVGNVRKFLTAEILHSSDLVTIVPGRTWGPFTLMRNTALMNNLFKLSARPLRDIFDSADYYCFDEWGCKPSDFRGSMTETLLAWGDDLGLRWHSGSIAVGWDGLCVGVNSSHCAECTFTGSVDSHSSELTFKDDSGSVYDVLLCHFQMGKSHALQSLQHGQSSKKIASGNGFKLSYLEGFQSLTNDYLRYKSNNVGKHV
jgi:hypothetical protein